MHPRLLLEKCRGTCLNGDSPFCDPRTQIPWGFHTVIPPPPPPKCIELPPCKPPRFIPELFIAPRPKNYQPLKYPCKYCPGPVCTRPGFCLHVPDTTSGQMCKYSAPCKAQCYHHRRIGRESG